MNRGPCNLQDSCDCEACEEDAEMPPSPRWDNVAPANEAQAKTWLGLVNETLNHYKIQGMPVVTLLSVVAQKIPGLRPENYSTVMAQVEKTLRESPDFEFRKGPRGGLFRKSNLLAPIHGTLPAPMPNVVSVKMADNYTCKGCGNSKLNSTEKSCWSCGRQVGT